MEDNEIKEKSITEQKEPKKKGTGFLIVLLILIVLGLAGYICFDKFLAKNEEPTLPKKSEKDSKKLPGQQEKEKTTSIEGYNCKSSCSLKKKIELYTCGTPIISDESNYYLIADGNEIIIYNSNTKEEYIIDNKRELFNNIDSNFMAILLNPSNKNNLIITYDSQGPNPIGKIYNFQGDLAFGDKNVDFLYDIKILDNNYYVRFVSADGVTYENSYSVYDKNFKLIQTKFYQEIYRLFEEAIVVKQDNAIKLYDYDGKELVKIANYSSNIAYSDSEYNAVDGIVEVFVLDKTVTKNEVLKDFPELFGDRTPTDEEWENEKDRAGYKYSFDLFKSKLTKTAAVCTWGGCLSWDSFNN